MEHDERTIGKAGAVNGFTWRMRYLSLEKSKKSAQKEKRMTAMMQTQLTGFYYVFFFFAPELDLFSSVTVLAFSERDVFSRISSITKISVVALSIGFFPSREKKSAASITKCA